MPVELLRHLIHVGPNRDRIGNQPPLPGIVPRHKAPVVRPDGSGERKLVLMHWGFLTEFLPDGKARHIKPAQVTVLEADMARHRVRAWTTPHARVRARVVD